MKNQSDNTPAFPIIHTLQGGPSEDGDMLLVETATFDDKILRFAIPIDNVQHVIAFLLIWVGKISAQGNRPETDDTDRTGSLPIPATSISIGEPHGDAGYLGISVGRAELVACFNQFERVHVWHRSRTVRASLNAPTLSV